MGTRFLFDLADVVRASGLTVVEVDGWEIRARGSGGYNAPKPDHIMSHHTASGPSSDGWGDVNYICFGDDDAPLANLYLSRDGTVYICAAGGTNTNGTGDCPHLEPDTMNSSAISIEAGNDGVGEDWPNVQQDAYVILVRALCSAYDIPSGRVHAHWEWTSRKIDPAGPSRWGSGSWNMDLFRAELAADVPPPPPLEDDMNPAAVSWGPDRYDVFVTGTDLAVWHIWHSDGAWSSWESLGGETAGSPSAASWAPGRLDVFITGTDNQLWTRWHDDDVWSDWIPLGAQP